MSENRKRCRVMAGRQFALVAAVWGLYAHAEERAAGKSLQILRDGKPEIVIVTPRGAADNAYIQGAARELQHWIAFAYGPKTVIAEPPRLPIVGEDEAPNGPAIHIGRTQRVRELALPFDELTECEYLVKRVGDIIVLAGKTDWGTWQATRDFLNDPCGLRWTGWSQWGPGMPGYGIPKSFDLAVGTLDRRVDLGRRVKIEEDFQSGKMPEFLAPYLSEWRVKDGQVETVGPVSEPGWYLRAKSTYQVWKVGLRVRKTEDDGIVFLRSRQWRLLLRRDELVLKSHHDMWKHACFREIDFPAGEWHEVMLEFDLARNQVRLSWDGKELKPFTDPLGEWPGTEYEEELKEIGMLTIGRPRDYLVLHAWHTGCALSDFKLEGVETGVAEGFAEPCNFFHLRWVEGTPAYYDNAFERIAPEKPVTVAPLDDGEKREKARPVGNKEERVLRGSVTVRNSAKAAIRIANAGDYTLKLHMNRMMNLGQVLEVKLNGTVVSREAYRGSGYQNRAIPLIKDYVPLRLAAGTYGLELRLDPVLLRKPGHAWTEQAIIGFTASLAPGIEEPSYVWSAKKPQAEEQLSAEATDYELFGKALNLRFEDLEPGDCTVELDFFEVLFDHPGQRLMDVAINRALAAENLDVVKEAGGTQLLLTKTFPATVQDGAVEVKLRGKNFQAFINAVRIKRDGKVLAQRNCGWVPGEVWYHPLPFRPLPSSGVPSYGLYVDPEKQGWTDERPNLYSDNNNLLANPSFTSSDKDGRVTGWRSAVELGAGAAFEGLDGKGEYGLDKEHVRSAPSALRIGKTEGDFAVTGVFPRVDYRKKQRLSGWISTRGARAKAWLEVYWFASNVELHAREAPPAQLLRVDRSEAVTGNTDWTLLEVEALPPFGALLAAAVVRAENGEGAAWVDDIKFDAYSAEPLQTTFSRLGFDTAGERRVLVRAAEKAPVSLQVFDDQTGEAALEAKGEYLGQFRFPDGHYYRFELAGLTRSGTYRLRARQGALRTESDAFRAEQGRYRSMTEKTLYALYTKRFGTDVPNVHEPGWLGDAKVPLPHPRFGCHKKGSRKTVNVFGGWFDAGDELKAVGLWAPPLFGALNSVLLLDRPLTGRCEDDAFDELKWGLESFIRHQREDGHFYYHFYRAYPHDGIPLFYRESPHNIICDTPQGGGILAMSAYHLRGRDPELAAACRDAAVKSYDVLTRTWTEAKAHPRFRNAFKKEGIDDFQDWNRLNYAPKALWMSMYLWKVTGRERYREDMESSLDDLLALLKKRTYFDQRYWNVLSRGSDGWRDNLTIFDYIWVPVWLARDFPDHPQLPAIKEAVYSFAKEVERVSSVSPYGQAHALAPESAGAPPRWPNVARTSRYWYSLAYALALAGDTWRDRNLVALAERQLQWMLGNNVLDISDVGGVGKRFHMHGSMRYGRPEFYREYVRSGRKLLLPFMQKGTGGLSRIGGGRVGYNKGARSIHLRGYIGGSPRGYPDMQQATPYDTEGAGPEFYLPLHGNVICAAAAMAGALEGAE